MNSSSTASWSIRRRMLTGLFLTMALIFAANLISSYYSTREAADTAYDRLLLASASAIAERIRIGEEGIALDLPYAALDMLASTAQDRIFYAVLAPDQSLVTGYADIPGPRGSHQVQLSDPVFYNAPYKGTMVRVISLQSFLTGSTTSGYATVQVAQTRGERDALSFALLLQSGLWMLAITIAGAFAAWLGVTNGLQPLVRLRDAIGRRSTEDTRPVLHDVPSELSPLLTAINGMLFRLEGGLTTMRRFISDASHQLKTPLAGLQIQTEMALRETDQKALREALKKVNESAQRTSRLAQQLMSHARATEPEAISETLDLAELSRDTISALLYLSVSNEIDLGYSGERELFMKGDRSLIGELIQNLVDNAIKYCPPQSVVTVKAVTDASAIVLSVEDNGGGIPIDWQSSVQERFVRIPGSSVDGCGLGLAIAKEIANRHKGDMTLHATTGGGLTVTVQFPLNLLQEL